LVDETNVNDSVNQKKETHMFNKIIAVGSVDGVLTAAAALTLCPEASVEFTQAFTVDQLQPQNWEPNRNVLFVDLAVNNQNAQMTISFVQAVLDAGHRIVGVCDEHNATAWQAVFDAVEIDISDLLVQPCSQKAGGFQSSGALLADTFSSTLSDHAKALCADADAADKMDFSGKFATIANQAVKSKIADNTRRVYIAKVLSTSFEADETISEWIREYDFLLAANKALIETRENLGDGIVRIDATGKVIDMTSLMADLYALDGVRVVILVGESYNKELGRKVVQHAFGTRDKSLDLQAALKASGINAGGFAQKANVNPDDADAAVEAIRILVA
jgi:hypothetical protein